MTSKERDRIRNKERAEYFKEYRKSNKIKIKEYEKEYRERNKRKRTELAEAYYKKHKERIREKQRRKYQRRKNPKNTNTPQEQEDVEISKTDHNTQHYMSQYYHNEEDDLLTYLGGDHTYK